MTIRPYEPVRDAEALRVCLVEHQEFHRALEPSWPEGAAIVEDYVAYLERVCAKRDGQILIAERDHDVIGFACVAPTLRSDSPDDPGPYAWLFEVYVKAPHRARGVGTALIGGAEAFARSRGAKEMRLAVLERNEGARAVYRARGFRDYTRLLVKPL